MKDMKIAYPKYSKYTVTNFLSFVQDVIEEERAIMSWEKRWRGKGRQGVKSVKRLKK